MEHEIDIDKVLCELYVYSDEKNKQKILDFVKELEGRRKLNEQVQQTSFSDPG